MNMAIKKEEERKKCIELRKMGESLRYIAKTVGVAKSSVTRWVKDVKLTEEQRKNLYKKRYGLQKKKEKKEKQVGHEVWSSMRRKVREEMQEVGRQKFLKEGKEYAFGCALFWAEGSKDRNSTILVNSDEDMLLFFAKFLRKYFNVKSDQITIKLQYYDNGDLTVDDIIKYWCDKLDVTPDNFIKPTLRNKYYTNNNIKYIYGIPTIQVNNTNITQQLYGSIKEMTNCKTDKWIF
jgi:transposase